MHGPIRSPSRSKRVILALIGSLAGYALLGFVAYHLKHPPWYQIIVHLLGKSAIYEVRTDPPLFEIRQADRPALTIAEIVELRHFFETRQFGPLEEKIEALQKSFEQDHSREYQIAEAWSIFNDSPPDQQQGFDAWIEHSPRHFAPYLARAFYFKAKAWESRGGKYAAETSKEQFRGMEEFFKLAGMDLTRAHNLNPSLLPVYLLRLDIANAQGGRADENKVFDDARKLFPDSYLLYSKILWARLPRWGGSYPDMERLARQALQQAKVTPEMYMLFGKIYFDQADLLQNEKKYAEAVELYTKALRYGQNFTFLEERARCYLSLGDRSRALTDVDQAIIQRPTEESPYRLRATICLHEGDFQSARRDIETAARLAPWSKKVRDWYSWAAGFLRRKGHTLFKEDLEGAIRCYDMVLEFEPDHAETYYWRGVAYSKLGKPDQALDDVRRSLIHDPARFDTCRMLDSLLAQKGEWDEIITNWDRFISLQPDHSGAYLERAGTYRHKGDMANALADLKMACDLGNEEACKVQGRSR